MAGSKYDADFLKEFYIPTYIFSGETNISDVPDAPKYPVLVFINSKSGGQLGGDLLVTYRTLLNERQVRLMLVWHCFWAVQKLFFDNQTHWFCQPKDFIKYVSNQTNNFTLYFCSNNLIWYIWIFCFGIDISVTDFRLPIWGKKPLIRCFVDFTSV